MFLVTTADKRFWKTDEQALFLGEWCRVFADRPAWEEVPHEVLPYHWCDRQQLHRDYQTIRGYHEKYLRILSEELNRVHGVSHSLRYWRILLGPWLSWFTETVFDRYRCIEEAAKRYEVTGTWIADHVPGRWTPLDDAQFARWQNDDGYNMFLFSQVIQELRRFPYEVIRDESEPERDERSGHVRAGARARLVAKRTIVFLSLRLLARFNRVVWVSSYFSPKALVKLQLGLRQMPHMYFDAPPRWLRSVSPDLPLRSSLEISQESASGFEKVLADLLPSQIPLVYLEGYRKVRAWANRSMPRRPKVIVTAIGIYNDLRVKFWSAELVERGAKLCIEQHGGHYGTGLWSSTEAHELAIADQYYTWGWEISGSTVTRPLSAPKLVGLKGTVQADPNGRILWALASVTRYSYWLCSVPMGPHMLEMIEDQFRFGRAVRDDVRRLLLLRTYPAKLGWDEEGRFRDQLPEVEVDSGTKSFQERLGESRLFVGTFNSTTFLETFAADYPTLLFWNPAHNELREEAQPYFQRLRDAQILHDTPELAAAHLNRISEDPGEWWRRPEVQEAKNDFSDRFAYVSQDWLSEWKDELSHQLRDATSGSVDR